MSDAVSTSQMPLTDEEKLNDLQQKEAILIDGLRDLPISQVSKLLTDAPDLDIPEDLLREVWLWRDEQDRLNRLQQQ